MKEQEISIFIDTMEDIGDAGWTPESVRTSEYFKMSLEEAIEKRGLVKKQFDHAFASGIDYLI